jgi:hypothetical protein
MGPRVSPIKSIETHTHEEMVVESRDLSHPISGSSMSSAAPNQSYCHYPASFSVIVPTDATLEMLPPLLRLRWLFNDPVALAIERTLADD